MIELNRAGNVKVVPLSSVSSVVKGLLPIRQRRIYVAEQDKEEAERIVRKSLKGGLEMAVKFTEKWNQYGLIAELAVRLKGVSPQFGKTVLQKLVYILQEVFQVPVGYDYILYNYGPYCAELADDLMFFASLDGVKVEWSDGLGFEIREASKTGHFRKRAEAFLKRYEAQISKAINNFGHMNARELELYSTIIYVAKEGPLTKDELIKRVSEIKP